MEETTQEIQPSHVVEMPPTRGYQQEMLNESLRRNIIIALDTGSGKTLIAVLRMKHEMERQTTKVRIDCPSSSKQTFSFCATLRVLRPNCRSLPTADGCNQGIPSRLRRHYFGCKRARSVERRCVMAARAQYPPYHGLNASTPYAMAISRSVAISASLFSTRPTTLSTTTPITELCPNFIPIFHLNFVQWS